LKTGGFMVGKSLTFLVLGLVMSATAYSQQSPEAKKENEKSARAFAWSFAGDGGYLGVQTEEVTKDNFSRFGLRDVRGVAVEKVIEDSPAASAGIQNGDVIVRFNGEEITSVRKLTRLIGEVDPDHKANVTILRGGREREITVVLGKRPMPKFADGNFTFTIPPMGKMELPEMGKLPTLPKGELPRVFAPGGEGNVFTIHGGARQIGIGIMPLTKQLAEHFRVESGAMISEVRENSPASKAALRAGDIIVEADGKPIKGQFDLIRAISEKKEGDVQLTIVRDGHRQTIPVTPEAGKDGSFFYQFGDDDGLVTPPAVGAPGQVRVTPPATAVMPMSAPAPMTLMRPGRIL
jgi:membrane-associated protease RseP (regulator of RpoE activity)